MSYVQISLDVVNKRSLEESLDFYCQGELMEGDNQYFCEEAGKKVSPSHPQRSQQHDCQVAAGGLRLADL